MIPSASPGRNSPIQTIVSSADVTNTFVIQAEDWQSRYEPEGQLQFGSVHEARMTSGSMEGSMACLTPAPSDPLSTVALTPEPAPSCAEPIAEQPQPSHSTSPSLRITSPAPPLIHAEPIGALTPHHSQPNPHPTFRAIDRHPLSGQTFQQSMGPSSTLEHKSRRAKRRHNFFGYALCKSRQETTASRGGSSSRMSYPTGHLRFSEYQVLTDAANSWSAASRPQQFGHSSHNRRT